MTKNEGSGDRVVRFLIAIGAAVAAFAVGVGSVAGVVLLLVAVIMLVTAAVGFCPLYRLFGLSTGPTRADSGLRR
jgi:Na+/H+ antiporter NhaD/arsenite permease-like protein